MGAELEALAAELASLREELAEVRAELDALDRGVIEAGTTASRAHARLDDYRTGLAS
jgi:prefoldin subunit 5